MGEKQTIYLVGASTGEYSDRDEWVVCAYADKALAEEHVLRIEQAIRSVCAVGRGGDLSYNQRERLEKALKEADPRIRIDYTGVRYYVVTVPIRDDVPTIAIDPKRILEEVQ